MRRRAPPHAATALTHREQLAVSDSLDEERLVIGRAVFAIDVHAISSKMRETAYPVHVVHVPASKSNPSEST